MPAIRPPRTTELQMNVVLESVLTCPHCGSCGAGNHGYGCLSVLLRVQQLQSTLTFEPGRLLRVLFVRLGQVPANSAAAHLLRLTVLLSRALGRVHYPVAAF
jgi:hypothetical protein